MSSRDFERGLLIGSSSVDVLHAALKKSLGEWARILPYLQRFRARAELELVAAINYILGRDVELTPTLKASIAADLVESEKRLLISDRELQLGMAGGAVGEEKGQG